jgi:uncharacterized membrane protein/glutaredoxin
MSKVFRLSLIVVVLLMLLLPTAKAQEPVVYGVFFYSPTCPHCREVMDNQWPAIDARFGNQLKVLFVDVTTREGSDLMQLALKAGLLESGAVPQLIIGTQVMIGSRDIPLYAPSLIEQGLATGGIAYPPIPSVESWFEQAGLGEFTPTHSESISLSADPANFVAIGVLVALLISLFLITMAAWQVLGMNKSQLLTALTTQIGWWMLLISTLTGFGLTLTLLFGGDEPSVIGLASAIGLIFLVFLATIGRKSTLRDLPNWLVPLTLIVGISSASYLSYVEMTLSDAVCGTIGNCNVVQQSDYAHIGGIPIGFLGVVGYVTMLLIWFIGRGEYKQFTNVVLLAFTILGTLFSIYLTFLEPFVIGATCVWCLLSALVMLILLWLIAPSILEAMLPKQKHAESL